jgi:hypothetical protein
MKKEQATEDFAHRHKKVGYRGDRNATVDNPRAGFSDYHLTYRDEKKREKKRMQVVITTNIVAVS